jgi:protein O-mannosyl-transferase
MTGVAAAAVDRPARGALGLLALAAGALTLVAFAPALGGQFLAWDDHYNFVANPHYRGLGWAQLRWMLTAGWSGHWIPVTWLTLGLDWVLWGAEPFGYHLTSLVLHAATAGVFVVVAARLLAAARPDAPPSALLVGATTAGLFFALHPLRVESVAWLSERRDVVSGLFYLLTVLAYLYACAASAGRRRAWLVVSLVAYGLALGSKAIVMSLPIVLVVLDAYPLRRLGRRTLLEKLPFVAIAVAGAGIALSLATRFKTAAEYPLWARPAVFGYNLVFYLWKTVLPASLSPLYELPERWEPSDVRLILGLALPVAATLALVAWRRRWPAGLAAWTVYVVTLTPVGGLAVHTGPQLAADRYTYLATLGLAVLVGGGACAVWQARVDRSLTRLAAVTAAVALAGLGVLTWQQSGMWRDDVTLWQYASAVDPGCAGCRNQLGVAQHAAGASAAAAVHLRRAVELRPTEAEFAADLGVVLLALDRPAEALPHLQRAVARYPGNLFLQTQLGTALAQAGRTTEGQRRLAAVLRHQPDDIEALTAMGFALTREGFPRNALPYLERAVARAPRAPAPRYALARAWLALGDLARAEQELTVLRALDPRLAEGAERR